MLSPGPVERSAIPQCFWPIFQLDSQRRAQAVKDYLIENHDIELRRFSDSYGYGEMKAVADNSSREGREQNRRVEVKLLVSRGINQSVEVKQNPNEE